MNRRFTICTKVCGGVQINARAATEIQTFSLAPTSPQWQGCRVVRALPKGTKWWGICKDPIPKLSPLQFLSAIRELVAMLFVVIDPQLCSDLRGESESAQWELMVFCNNFQLLILAETCYFMLSTSCPPGTFELQLEVNEQHEHSFIILEIQEGIVFSLGKVLKRSLVTTCKQADG